MKICIPFISLLRNLALVVLRHFHFKCDLGLTEGLLQVFFFFSLTHQYDQSLSKGLLFSTVCPVWLVDVKIQLIPRAGLHTLTFSAFCFNFIDCVILLSLEFVQGKVVANLEHKSAR